jgi:hypothetical protein
MNVVDNLNSVLVINKPCMSSRCMGLLPRTALHNDSEQVRGRLLNTSLTTLDPNDFLELGGGGFIQKDFPTKYEPPCTSFTDLGGCGLLAQSFLLQITF